MFNFSSDGFRRRDTSRCADAHRKRWASRISRVEP